MCKPNELEYTEWWDNENKCYHVTVLTLEEREWIKYQNSRLTTWQRFSKWIGRLGRAAALAIHR